MKIKVLDPTSPHAFPDEALLMLTIDPRTPNARMYLRSAVAEKLIRDYPRGKVARVYNRADIIELADKLDNGHVRIDTSTRKFICDFVYEKKSI